MRKVLILDIGRERLWAGVFSAGKPDARGFVSAEIRSGDMGLKEALSEVITELAGKRGAAAFDRALVSMPADELSIRIVEMPFNERKKVLEALPFELAGLLHVEVEEVVTDAVQLGNGRFLAIAAERKLVRGYLETLRQLGIDPCWMGSALFAIPALAADLYGAQGVKALLLPGSMAVMEGASPRLFKSTRRLDGVRLGASFLESEGLAIDEVHYAGWDEGALKEIFDRSSLIPMDLPAGCPPEGASVYALALIEAKGLLNDTVNFRRGEFEYTRDKASFMKGVKIAACLAAALVLLAAGDLYVRYMGLSAELESYRLSLRSSYIDLFPGEQNVSDPVYQLEAKLKAIEKEGASIGMGVNTLDALRGIAEAAPAGAGIKITELAIADDGRVMAKGEAASFEVANSLKESIAKGPLRDVSLNETKARPEGGASFSINAYLR